MHGITRRREGGAPRPQTRKPAIKDWQLKLRIQVALVPGDAFGVSGEGFLRCCYATAFDQLKEAANRMERFVGTLG